MHIGLLTLSLSALTATTLAAPPLESRDIPASAIVADVLAIDTGVNHLRAGVAAYEGGLLEQTPLLAGFTEIHLANRKGFADAKLRATDFTAAESTRIIDTVVGTVGEVSYFLHYRGGDGGEASEERHGQRLNGRIGRGMDFRVLTPKRQDIPAAVQETIAKKALFQASGTGDAMVGLLKVLLNDHDTFSAAVSRHLTADREAGAAVVAKIHDAIQEGIDAFSS